MRSIGRSLTGRAAPESHHESHRHGAPGRVYPEVLETLVERTLTIRQEHNGVPVIWLVHFAPFDCGYQLRLIDFADVDDAAQTLGVQAMLCGHVHQSRKLQRDNRVIYCSGSAGCVDTENDARIQIVHFDVAAEVSVSRENFIWDREEHEFVFLSAD